MRKCAIFLFTALLLFTRLAPAAYAAYTPPVNIEIHSEAVLLVNLDTNRVIYEKNADKQMVPASLVKIMVCILALEYEQENGLDIDTDTLTAPNYVFDLLWGQGASTADIRHRETMTMRNFLYGLMLQSAAEAALTIADYIGDGSIEYFVELMNAKAEAIGCENTHFVNPHGLYEPEQYTTAQDMYLIARYAMELPEFMEIASTYTVDIGHTNKHEGANNLFHTIKMMSKSSEYYYEPVRGIKSGTLPESGRCLITTASLDGFNYLLVTLGAPQYGPSGEQLAERLDYKDHINLYEWAFDNFSYKTLMEEDRNLAEIPVRLSFQQDYVKLKSGARFSDLVPNTYDAASVVVLPEILESLDAPVERGQTVGYARLLISGEEIGTVPLVTSQAVERSELLYLADQVVVLSRTYWFKFGLVLAISAFFFYLILMVARNRSRRRYKRVVHRRRL